MSRRYILLSVLLLIAGLGLVLLPQRSRVAETEPGELLAAIDDPARFMSTDLVTEKIISKNPSLQLIDLRSPAEYKAFTLPGAINIRFDSLLSPSSIGILSEQGKQKVLFSNDDVLSGLAWQLCRRRQFVNVFIMHGGLNQWFNTIMKDTVLPETDPQEMHQLMAFRKAARQYFTGSGRTENTIEGLPQQPSSKKQVKIMKKSNAASGGGC